MLYFTVGYIAPPAEIIKPKENGNGDHIDSQVANFLAVGFFQSL